jgi:CRP-like cAMP-binding protein
MKSVELSPLTRKLSAFVALSEVELAVLERLHQRRRSFVAGRDMVHQGQSAQAAYILSAGWVCSYKLQADGTRQIVDFQVPGDFWDCAAFCCARRTTASNPSSISRLPKC